MCNDYKVAQIVKCKMTEVKRGIRPQALKQRGKPTLRFMRMRGVGCCTLTRRKQETHFERF